MNTKTRDLSIDFIRGLAILSVICGHYIPGRIYSFIFSFHIPLFIMISGYLFEVKDGFIIFIKKLFRRIYIPYILASVAIIFLDYIMNHDFERLYSVLLGYANPGLDRSIIDINLGMGPLWYLPAMFITELIAYLLIKYCGNNATKLMISSITISILGGGV